MARIIKWALTIAWDGTTPVTETTRLVSATGQMRLVPPGESLTSSGGIVDTCTLTLQNADGRYSPLLTTGALYANLQNGGAYHRPVTLTVSVDDGANYYAVFKGVIKTPVESAPTASDGATVEIECRSMEEDILSRRFSTSRANFASYHDTGKTEAELISIWLQAAGVAVGNIDVDPGFFVLPWAWLDDESPLADAWAMAAACGGRLYSTPDGVFHYENAAHWLYSPHTVSQATITGANATRIQPWYNDKELYNSVTVEVSERAVLDEDEIWKADDVVVVPANNAADPLIYIAKMRQPAYAIDSLEYTAITSGGIDITASVTITRSDFAQRSILTITNAHATQAANLVVLKLIGNAVSGRPGAEVVETSANAFWSARAGRERALRGNPYVQTQGQAGFVAEFLKDRMELPTLFFKVDGVPGIPERRLGDRITINDAAIMSASRDAFVTAINWRLGSNGFSQNYEAMDAVGLYPYENSYFVIGVDSLNLTASARVFY